MIQSIRNHEHSATDLIMLKQIVFCEVKQMAKQEISSIDKYNATFPTILRELMNRHPNSGNSTTQKALAQVLDIRPQTVSLYMNGATQPTPDTLVNIARYFDVSVDYLLTGVSSYNKETNKELGLTETSIQMLQRANEMEAFDGMPRVIDTLNNLLSDKDFYEFLNDLSFKANAVRGAANMTPEQKQGMDNLNVEGYYIWDMQMYIQEFIQEQLAKNGLEIENE